jgi:hypothetical protein
VAEKFSLISAAAEYPLPEGKKKYDDAGDSQFLRSLEFTLEKYDGFVQIRDLDGSRCIRITLQAT